MTQYIPKNWPFSHHCQDSAPTAAQTPAVSHGGTAYKMTLEVYGRNVPDPVIELLMAQRAAAVTEWQARI
ncbi:MAG: hypothetical protein LBR56_08290 [Sporomusaceae bacterium]|nr:hypothetical protein [Sporomusaceae bacterium]